MSIADDPSSWTSKPKESGGVAKLLAKSAEVDITEYWILRDALIEIHNMTSSISTRRMCRKALNGTEARREKEAPLDT